MMVERKQVLLLRPDRAGDAIKTLPVLRTLSSAEPDIDFHLLASEHNASLFAFEPRYILHILPRHWKKMKRDKLLTSLGPVDFPAQFSRAVNLLCDPSSDLDLLLDMIPAEKKFSIVLNESKGAPRPGFLPLSLPEATPAHRDESENIALLLSQVFNNKKILELQRFPRSPVLTSKDEAEALEKMGAKSGPWLGFCPFAGKDHRTHPLRRWEKFIRKVTQDGLWEKFFLFGTPSDYACLEKLRQISPRRESIELCFPSTFRTLGAYLKRLDGVVAVDSGPLHLAQSLGVNSFGVLSGGDIQRWFPKIKVGDYLLRRGIFNRFPSVFEMIWAFEKWRPQVGDLPAASAPPEPPSPTTSAF
jgi:ADP-heptose:LPS heptosyltransferase